MFKKDNKDKKEKEQQDINRFYLLLKALMDEIFDYAAGSKHIKMPYNVSFGLIYDKKDSILFTGLEKNTGKKTYLYNVRILAKMFEERREKMINDGTAASLFEWIGDVCSLYISPFVYDHVVNTQHRGKAAADRTTRQIVKGFLSKLTSDQELKYVLDIMRERPHETSKEDK